jgi:hypothetical protein
MLSVQELKPAEPISFSPLDKIMDKAYEIKKFLGLLRTISFPRRNDWINEQLGKWIRNSMHLKYENGITPVKLGAPNIIDAYKLLFEDAKSDYYVPADRTGTDMFNVYNAFTEVISNKDNKDIMNKCEKILLLKDILGIS